MTEIQKKLLAIREQVMKKNDERNNTHQYAPERNDTVDYSFAQGNTAINSTYTEHQERNMTISAYVDEFLYENKGKTFTNQQIDGELLFRTRREKEARRQTLLRREKAGIVTKLRGDRIGWRILSTKASLMDFNAVDPESFSIPLPLQIGEMAEVYNGSIILVAGTSNAGKTAFLMYALASTLTSVRGTSKSSPLKNMCDKGIRYLNSEMSAAEILEWEQSLNTKIVNDVEFMERSEHFDEALIPDGLNFIDFLEVHEDFYSVGEKIRAIHDELTTGVAIIAIQKRKGAEFGIGGQFTMHKPRLVITLERTDSAARIAKLTKVKKATDRDNSPEDKQIDYVIQSDGKFRAITEWRFLTEKQRIVQNDIYTTQGVVVPRDMTSKYSHSIQLKGGEGFAQITDKDVDKWQLNFPNTDVDEELNKIARSSVDNPFLLKKSWFFTIAGILGKRNGNKTKPETVF